MQDTAFDKKIRSTHCLLGEGLQPFGREQVLLGHLRVCVCVCVKRLVRESHGVSVENDVAPRTSQSDTAVQARAEAHTHTTAEAPHTRTAMPAVTF